MLFRSDRQEGREEGGKESGEEGRQEGEALVSKPIQLDIQEQVLDSGLTLLAVRNPGVATYACVVSLDVRGSDEAVEDTGLANLVGECLDEGSRDRDALEFAAAVESIGGAAEGNMRGGSIYAPAEFQKDANELLRELVLKPAFPGREVRRVQGEILKIGRAHV